MTLKCKVDDFQAILETPGVSPAIKWARYHWITIERLDKFRIEDLYELVITSYELIASTFPKKIKRKLLKHLRHDMDSPWKDIIDLCFKEFIEFFYPHIAQDIDWSKAPIFLDKELSQITFDAKTGKRYVDKLVKVWRTNGDETWVLLHIEIQGTPQDHFPERMFTYSTLLRERYQLMVVSLAILADDNPNWHPKKFTEELWGCRKTFEFPVIKLLDYKDQWEKLEASDNPFAVVVMAHLKMLETKNDHKKRLISKVELTQMLYDKGYSKEKVFALYRFIDWLMVLPADLSRMFYNTISKQNEVHKMKYLTSIEQIIIRDARLAAQKIGEERGEKRGEIVGQIKILDTMRQNNLITQLQYEQMIQPLKSQLKEMIENDSKMRKKRYYRKLIEQV